jgi:hypothetical protein
VGIDVIPRIQVPDACVKNIGACEGGSGNDPGAARRFRMALEKSCILIYHQSKKGCKRENFYNVTSAHGDKV